MYGCNYSTDNPYISASRAQYPAGPSLGRYNFRQLVTGQVVFVTIMYLQCKKTTQKLTSGKPTEELHLFSEGQFH